MVDKSERSAKIGGRKQRQFWVTERATSWCGYRLRKAGINRVKMHSD